MNHLPSAIAGRSDASGPITLPITVEQYEALVDRGDFDLITGQVELIHGRIVQMNPQGPRHSDPIDLLTEWSIEQTQRRFTIRIEKPIVIPAQHSCPEPDIAWVDRRRYVDRHPGPEDIKLLIEVSMTSIDFDRTEKMELYAAAEIPEYWQIDVPSRTVIVHREPHGSAFGLIQSHGVDDAVSPHCMPEAILRVDSLFVD